MTHTQVAESLGRSRTTVSNLLRLLALTCPVKEMINTGLLEMGHARALLSLSSKQQIEAADVLHLIAQQEVLKKTLQSIAKSQRDDKIRTAFVEIS